MITRHTYDKILSKYHDDYDNDDVDHDGDDDYDS